MGKSCFKIFAWITLIALGAVFFSMQFCLGAHQHGSVAGGAGCFVRCAGQPTLAAQILNIDATLAAVVGILLVALSRRPLRLAASLRPTEWRAPPPHQPPQTSW